MTLAADRQTTGSGVPGAEAVGPALVRVDGVSKSYGATQALHEVSLEIQPGRSHALVGRNGAGKSTLVKILTGLESADSGRVLFGGEPAPATSRRREWAERVACVHQRSMVVPHLSVAENLMLESIAQGGPLLSWRRIRQEAGDLLDSWGLSVDLETRAGDLTVGERQLLEIARSLRVGTHLIILDEPTSQLQAGEIEVLFANMTRLKAQGITFLYISHHLAELYEVCDVATVLRDGRHIVTDSVAALPRDAMVEAMVGASVGREGPRQSAGPTEDRSAPEPVLQLDRLSMGGAFEDVTMRVDRGERVGVAGIAGCGKVQLAATVAGLAKADTGTVRVSGVEPKPGQVGDAIDKGIAYVPEDRHHNGFCANLSIEENLTSGVLGRLSRGGFVSARSRRALGARLFRDLDIRASSPRQLAGELSGGNQQKVVIGRALASEPDVLVLASPTAGIDIAAKQVIFEHVRDLECAVLIVSDDLEELGLCDRVLVMFEGRLRAEFGAERSDDQLVAAMEGVG